jgi:hypothetical protein
LFPRRIQGVFCKNIGAIVAVSAQKIRLLPLFLFLVLVLILGQVLIFPNSAYAQNQSGNYFRETLPVYPSQPDYVISQWRVITSSGLNCRSNAGTDFDVVKVLTSGETFQVKTSEGRDQHNNPTKLDSRGLPWFMVTDSSRSSRGKVECFVRANSRYIEPIITETNH